MYEVFLKDDTCTKVVFPTFLTHLYPVCRRRHATLKYLCFPSVPPPPTPLPPPLSPGHLATWPSFHPVTDLATWTPGHHAEPSPVLLVPGAWCLPLLLLPPSLL